MAADNALNFLRGLQRNPPAAIVHLISGPQAFLREYVLDSLRRALASGKSETSSFQIGAGDDFGAALESVNSRGLFASETLVTCRVLRSRRDKGGDDDEATDNPRGASGEAGVVAAIP